MATYQQRGSSWRVQVRVRGSSLSKTLDTHEEARTWAAGQEAKLLAGAKVRNGEAVFMTVADLFDRYAKEVSPTKRGERWEVIRLEMLQRDAAFGKSLRDFAPEDVAQWRDDRLKIVSAATVNREMNVISAVFKKAIKAWRIPLRENPVHLTERPALTLARRRRVPDREILAIRAQLGWDGVTPPKTTSQWVAWVHALAIETAMRKGEILGLSRSRVHLEHAFAQLMDGSAKDGVGQTKTGRGRDVPLSRRARELLEMAGPGDPYEPIAQVSSGSCDTLFRRAVKAAKIPDLHFHDSRREATTRIAPKVGNSMDLAKITGHTDHRQLMDYYAPSATDLAKKLD